MSDAGIAIRKMRTNWSSRSGARPAGLALDLVEVEVVAHVLGRAGVRRGVLPAA